MFDKLKKALRAKIFPCEQIIRSVLAEHVESLTRNIEARERLQAVCQQGQVCRAEAAKQQAKR